MQGAQQASKPSKMAGLNLNKVQDEKRDFQDMFLAKYDEFSESWREGVR